MREFTFALLLGTLLISAVGCGSSSDVVSPEMTQERQQQFDATQEAVQNEEMQQQEALQTN